MSLRQRQGQGQERIQGHGQVQVHGHDKAQTKGQSNEQCCVSDQGQGPNQGQVQRQHSEFRYGRDLHKLGESFKRLDVEEVERNKEWRRNVNLGMWAEKVLLTWEVWRRGNSTISEFIAFTAALILQGLYVYTIYVDARVIQSLLDNGHTTAAGFSIAFIVTHYIVLDCLLLWFLKAKLVQFAVGAGTWDREWLLAVSKRLSGWRAAGDALSRISIWRLIFIPPVFLMGFIALLVLVPLLDLAMIGLEIINYSLDQKGRAGDVDEDKQNVHFRMLNFMLQYQTIRTPIQTLLQSAPNVALKLILFLQFRDDPSEKSADSGSLNEVIQALILASINVVVNLLTLYFAMRISGVRLIRYLSLALQFKGAATLPDKWVNRWIAPNMVVDASYKDLELPQKMKVLQAAVRRDCISLVTPVAGTAEPIEWREVVKGKKKARATLVMENRKMFQFMYGRPDNMSLHTRRLAQRIKSIMAYKKLTVNVNFVRLHMLDEKGKEDKGNDFDISDRDLEESKWIRPNTQDLAVDLIAHPYIYRHLVHVNLINCNLDASIIYNYDRGAAHDDVRVVQEQRTSKLISCMGPMAMLLQSPSIKTLDLSHNPLFVFKASVAWAARRRREDIGPAYNWSGTASWVDPTGKHEDLWAVFLFDYALRLDQSPRSDLSVHVDKPAGGVRIRNPLKTLRLRETGLQARGASYLAGLNSQVHELDLSHNMLSEKKTKKASDVKEEVPGSGVNSSIFAGPESDWKVATGTMLSEGFAAHNMGWLQGAKKMAITTLGPSESPEPELKSSVTTLGPSESPEPELKSLVTGFESSVKELDLSCTLITDTYDTELAKTIFHSLAACSSLQTLNLSYNKLNLPWEQNQEKMKTEETEESGATKTEEPLAIESHAKRQRETVKGENQKPRMMIQVLGESLRNNTTLTSLRLRSTGLKNKDGMEVVKDLIMQSAVVCIDVSQNEVGKEGAEELSGAFKEGLSLKKKFMRLELNNCSIPRSGITAICQGLKNIDCLRALDLSHNAAAGFSGKVAPEEPQPNGASKQQKEPTKKPEEVKTRIAAERDMVDAAKDLVLMVHSIGQVMETNKLLQHLSLSKMHLDTEAAFLLAGWLRKMEGNLLSLNLSHNPLGTEGAVDILDALRASTESAQRSHDAHKVDSKLSVGIDSLRNTFSHSRISSVAGDAQRPPGSSSESTPPGLQLLSLAATNLTDLDAILREVQDHKTLRLLDLTCNFFHSVTQDSFKDFNERNKCLEDIDIRWNQLDSESCRFMEDQFTSKNRGTLKSSLQKMTDWSSTFEEEEIFRLLV